MICIGVRHGSVFYDPMRPEVEDIFWFFQILSNFPGESIMTGPEADSDMDTFTNTYKIGMNDLIR
jgi:hypothetical protein